MKSALDTARLSSRRHELGLTQAEAAALIGVTQPAYQRYEAGTRVPSVQVVKEIGRAHVKEMAQAFQTSASYLTGESDQKKPDYILIGKAESPLLYSVVECCRNYNEEQLKRLTAYLNDLAK